MFPDAASGKGYVFLTEVGLDDGQKAQECPLHAQGSGADHHRLPYVTRRSFVFALSGEMANSVRFGKVGGKTRLMVGSQVGEYYMGNNVKKPNHSSEPPTAFLIPSRPFCINWGPNRPYLLKTNV